MAASANPIPVLPDVPSMIVPPGFNLPSASASSTILRAILSLVEFPGLKVSTLAKTKASIPSITLLSFTNGVFPIVPNMFSAYFIRLSYCFYGFMPSQARVIPVKSLKFDYKDIDKKKVCKFVDVNSKTFACVIGTASFCFVNKTEDIVDSAFSRPKNYWKKFQTKPNRIMKSRYG